MIHGVGGNPNWPLVQISAVCESIVDCVNKTAPLADGPTPYKMLRTTNIRDGFVDVNSCRYVSEETFTRWTRRQKPQRHDIILTREAPLGEVGMLRSDDFIFLGQRLLSYRVNPQVNDANFLLYSLMSPYMQEQIRSLGSGSTVEHMRVPDAESLLVRLPDLQTQQRIGSILAAYDHLIELNQRRIMILEDMGKRLFEGWFVRFRYPGYETVPLVDTEFGLAPEGWHSIRCDYIIDFDPKTKVLKEGIKTFVPMSSLDTSTSIIGDLEERVGNSGSKFQNGDTLMARITPCLENGKTGLVNFLMPNTSAFGSTEFIVMRGRRVPSSFVYLLARSEGFRAHAIKSMSGASGRQRVRSESLKQYRIHCPPNQLLISFDKQTGSTLRQIRLLSEQNTRLRAARDLLLPKLISGELDVSRAERRFAEAAE